MRILAIDPGFDRLGIAVLEGDPSRPTLLESDCLTPAKGEASTRLAVVFREVDAYIDRFSPDSIAIESLFFGANKTSVIGVAEARGAVLSVAGLRGLPVREISPQQVKLAVTGYGASDKKAVAAMVPKLVALTEKKRLDDELDAIAVGIAALASRYPHS